MKKRSKKGVTLVELIAVIAILGVISTIGFAVYGGIRKKTLEEQYKNLISLLETKAEKYAFDTGLLDVNVETLIKEGYIDADDKDGHLYNPVNKESLNCYVINNSYKNNGFIAKFDKSGPKKNGNSCANLAMNKAYKLYFKTGEEIKDKWYKDLNLEIIVKEFRNNQWIDANFKEIRWYNKKGLNVVSKEKYYPFNQEGITELNAEIKDADGKVLGIASANIKYDKTPPTVDEVFVDNSNYTSTKDIIFKKLSDKNSGLKAVEILDVNDNVLKKNEIFSDKHNVDKYTFNSWKLTKEQYDNYRNHLPNFKYRIVDNAGNVKTNNLVIKIDNDIDTISLVSKPNYPTGTDKNGNTIAKESVTLTGTVKDTLSGINGYYFAKEDVTKNYIDVNPILYNEKDFNEIYDKNDRVCFYVKDTAGNKSSTCIGINNIDEKKPTGSCKFNVNNHKSATINCDISDDKGIYRYALSKNSSLSKYSREWINGNKDVSILDISKSDIQEDGKWYLYIEDIVGKTEKIEINVQGIDALAPTAKIKVLSGPDKNYNVVLEGTGQDNIKVESYCFSNNSESCNWFNYNNKKKKINTEGKNGKWCFYVRDGVGNESTPSCIKLDDEAPIYNDTYTSISTTGNNDCKIIVDDDKYTDDSKYSVSYGITTEKSKIPTSFDYNGYYYQPNSYKKFNTYCGSTYYVWSKAVDIYGNTSINEIGSQYSGKNCNEGSWKNSGSCSSDGWQHIIKDNECTGVVETDDVACIYNDGCGSWSSCINNEETRTCYYYEGGEYKSTDETRWCKSEPPKPENKCTGKNNICSTNKWSEAFIENSLLWWQYQDDPKNMIQINSQNELHECNSCIMEKHCNGADVSYNGNTGIWTIRRYSDNYIFERKVVLPNDLENWC